MLKLKDMTFKDIIKRSLIIGVISAIFYLIIVQGIFIFYYGTYEVTEQWIASEYNNKTICNNCLFIKFYEGCNRYRVYYFENQHELDSRLEPYKPVDILFNEKGYVRGVFPRIKYLKKC